MKCKLLNPIFIIIFLIVTFLGLIIYYSEDYTVKAIIIEHNVTADRMGARTYTTIVKCNDGYIRELTGLNYYVMPIGSSFNITEKRINFNKK